MRIKTIIAFTCLYPVCVFGQADVNTFHVEIPISQNYPAPECLGLPDGATIAEDFLQVIDVRTVLRSNGGTRVTVVESNGTASANDGAWIWEIRLHRASVNVFNDDGADTYSFHHNRQFISKQPGVPNLHRTVHIVLVINAQGEVIVDSNPSVEVDFTCSP